MTLDIFDIRGSGGGHYEYLLHFSGMPWYVTTSKHLIDNLTSAQRRLIFNDQYYTDGGSNYLADYIQGYPLLQMPERQAFDIQPGFGSITGGTWYAEIADRHVVNGWHGQTRDIYGLEGLTAVADPDSEATLGIATLYQPYRADDSELVVIDDIGGRLNTRITAAGPEPYYLWINGECVGSDGIDSLVNGVLTISTPTGAGVHGSGWRGLLRSKNAGHFTNTANSAKVRVTDAPLNGILGRPYCLWEFARLRDGTYTSPFLLRHGKTGLDIQHTKDKTYRIQCLPWIKWLDRDVELAEFKSQMRRYVFSRGPNATVRHEPPLRIYEFDGSNWAGADVWLGGAASFDVDTTFETLEELYETVAAQCTIVSAASLNSREYGCGPGGPYNINTGYIPRMDGPLPAILRWGDIDANASLDEEWQDKLAKYWVANKPENEFWWADSITEVITQSMPCLDKDEQISAPRTNPPYIIQYYQHTGTIEDLAEEVLDLPAHMDKFPLTPCGPGNQYRIWLDPELDASDVEDGDTIQIGSKLITFDSNEKPTAAKATVDAAGTFGGDPDNSYFDIKDIGTFTDEAPTVRYIEGVPTDVDQVPEDQSNATFKKFAQGMFLYYIPELHEQDPWPVGVRYTVGPAEKMSYILRAILGENMSAVNVYCPEHVQADDVPDCSPGVCSATWDNQNPTIDWDSFDMVVNADTLQGVTFQAELGGKLNLMKYITEELKFYGATFVREPDPTTMQFLYRVRRAGETNAAMSALGNRRLTAAHISTKGAELEAAAEVAANWILNTAEVSFGYDPLEKRYLYTWPFRNTSGFAVVGGRTNELKVETRITQIDVNNPQAKLDVANHFIGILNRFCRGMPVFSCGAGGKTLLTHGLGTDVLCTYDAVHHPGHGTMGITQQPGVIVGWSHDPRKNRMTFKVQIAKLAQCGIPPTVVCAANDSTKVDNNNVTIDDIEDSGQKYAGQTMTTAGWYDHWFFDCLVFNQTMSGPQANPDCSCIDYGVIVWELDTESPTVYTGMKVKDVSTGDYAAGGPFMTIYDPVGGGGLATWDSHKRWAITYCDFDHAHLQPCQMRWVFEADDDLQLLDSAATIYSGRRWT